MTTVTFAEYLKRAARRKELQPTHRMGQCYYNQLAEDRPELAAAVTHTQGRGYSVDPFHNDEKIPAFLAYICKRW